tara:strand:+ start:3451 stop:4119 length:669 start_codon:yes stop_codon:yes gene_type:complete
MIAPAPDGSTALGTPASPFRTAQQRQQDRTAKRDALLLAAARMFNDRGFHATSLDDVAASLGVTKPTIYHYLGNKERVLIECMRIGLVALQKAADDVDGAQGNGMEKLRMFLIRYAQVNMSEFGQCVIRTGDEHLVRLGPRLCVSYRNICKSHSSAAFAGCGLQSGATRIDLQLVAANIAPRMGWLPADERERQRSANLTRPRFSAVCKDRYERWRMGDWSG